MKNTVYIATVIPLHKGRKKILHKLLSERTNLLTHKEDEITFFYHAQCRESRQRSIKTIKKNLAHLISETILLKQIS